MNHELLIKNIEKHINLTETEKEYVQKHFKHKKINKKDFLLQEGEVCHSENFIVKGCLRLYSIDNDGFEHIVMFGIEDWWIGDLYSFLTQTPSAYFIDAIENTDVLQISKENLEKLYTEIPKFERFFRIMFQNAFVAQQNRINQNLLLSAEERYAEFRNKYPQFDERITQKQIAAYLGITPVFLSMIRKKWSLS